MKIVTGEMGSGKTTFLVKESAKTGATIVIRSSMINVINATAKTLNLSIPTPLSYYDIVEHRYHGVNIKGLLIDDIEAFLSHMMTIPVEAISTRDVEIIEVHKRDWMKKGPGWDNCEVHKYLMPDGHCTCWDEPKPEFKGTTTDHNDPGLKTILDNGMQQKYLVLTEEERKKGFVRPFRDSYKHLKCGTVTTMGRAIAETYARNPKFYGGTYCVHCKDHFPLKDYSETKQTPEGHPVYEAQFVWVDDGTPVGD